MIGDGHCVVVETYAPEFVGLCAPAVVFVELCALVAAVESVAPAVGIEDVFAVAVVAAVDVAVVAVVDDVLAAGSGDAFVVAVAAVADVIVDFVETVAVAVLFARHSEQTGPG